MATKGNLKSIRISDEVLEMIESQAGDNFTAKFEALVTRCMWELPKKEQELAWVREQIDQERKNLRYIQNTRRRLQSNLNLIESRTTATVQEIDRVLKELNKL